MTIRSLLASSVSQRAEPPIPSNSSGTSRPSLFRSAKKLLQEYGIGGRGGGRGDRGVVLRRIGLHLSLQLRAVERRAEIRIDTPDFLDFLEHFPVLRLNQGVAVFFGPVVSRCGEFPQPDLGCGLLQPLKLELSIEMVLEGGVQWFSQVGSGAGAGGQLRGEHVDL